ncbi:TetR/AcrR family transcriptional regulator [Sphingobacterium anhuiense]|uniref:TetR/AcrR family transcriptional regulator n=1 Tax=Sphingobacterium anhuiense TaxID=493780 RepID=A0ABW5YVK8_9SPHI
MAKEQQSRKTYQGVKNNKERTMGKAIAAVGKVLAEKGYTGLTMSNISKYAEIDRKLIYAYFGTVENLVETYIKGKDYWVSATEGAAEFFGSAPAASSMAVLESLLLNQFDELRENREMQKIVAWQMSEESSIMSEIAQEREKMSALFFAFADKELQGKDLDLRGVVTILVAGIYYIVLHSENVKSTVCEIDISTEEGMDRIKTSIKKIVGWAYSSVEETTK